MEGCVSVRQARQGSVIYVVVGFGLAGKVR